MNAPTPDEVAAAVRVCGAALDALRPAVDARAWDDATRAGIVAACAVVARACAEGASVDTLKATATVGLYGVDLLARTIVPTH